MVNMTNKAALFAIDTVARGCALHADKCVGSMAKEWGDACTTDYQKARQYIELRLKVASALENRTLSPCGVPAGVWYDQNILDFWNAHTGRRLSEDFRERWYARRQDFPKSSSAAISDIEVMGE